MEALQSAMPEPEMISERLGTELRANGQGWARLTASGHRFRRLCLATAPEGRPERG